MDILISARAKVKRDPPSWPRSYSSHKLWSLAWHLPKLQYSLHSRPLHQPFPKVTVWIPPPQCIKHGTKLPVQPYLAGSWKVCFWESIDISVAFGGYTNWQYRPSSTLRTSIARPFHIPSVLHEQVPKGTRHCKAPKQAAATKGSRTGRENTPHALHKIRWYIKILYQSQSIKAFQERSGITTFNKFLRSFPRISIHPPHLHIHNTSIPFNTTLLIGSSWFVIVWKPKGSKMMALLSTHHRTGVPQVGHQKPSQLTRLRSSKKGSGFSLLNQSFYAGSGLPWLGMKAQQWSMKEACFLQTKSRLKRANTTCLQRLFPERFTSGHSRQRIMVVPSKASFSRA